MINMQITKLIFAFILFVGALINLIFLKKTDIFVGISLLLIIISAVMIALQYMEHQG